MKKLLIVVVVAALSFWGCSENSNLTGPTDAQSNQSFLKMSDNIEVSELSVEAKSVLGVDDVNTLSKSWLPKSVKKLISAEEGGTMRIMLADKGTYSIGKLNILAGSLSQDARVKIKIVAKEAALDFTPDVAFMGNPAELTVGFFGVDVNVNDDVKFVYMSDGQEFEVDGEIIVGNGWVIVVKAKLGHFSRFGFTK